MSIPIIDQLRPLGNFPAVDASDVQAGNERLSTRLSNTPTTAQVDAVVANKVDKVDGKGLSTNDFTNAYKSKLDGLDDALAAKANTSDVTSGLAGKVDKETGKGLSTNDYTTTEKNKLSGIEAQANKTDISTSIPLTPTDETVPSMKLVSDTYETINPKIIDLKGSILTLTETMNLSNITLRNGTVKMGTSQDHNPQYEVALLVGSNVTIDNIVFDSCDDFYVILTLKNSRNIRITNCKFLNTTFNNIYVEVGNENIIIENNFFDNIVWTDRTTFEYRYHIASGSRNLAIDNTDATFMVRNFVVRNNIIKNNPLWEAIDCHGGENVTIENNYCENVRTGIMCALDARFIANPVHRNIKVVNNTLIANGLEATTGIVCGGNTNIDYIAENIIISNNQVHGFNTTNQYEAPIRIRSCKNTEISNNVVTGSPINGILFGGFTNNTKIFNNDIVATGDGVIRINTYANINIDIKNNKIDGLNSAFYPLYVNKPTKLEFDHNIISNCVRGYECNNNSYIAKPSIEVNSYVDYMQEVQTVDGVETYYSNTDGLCLTTDFDDDYTVNGTSGNDYVTSATISNLIVEGLRVKIGEDVYTVRRRYSNKLVLDRTLDRTYTSASITPVKPSFVRKESVVYAPQGKNIFNIEKCLTDRGVSFTKNNNEYTFAPSSALNTSKFYFSDIDIPIIITGTLTNVSSSNVRISLINQAGETVNPYAIDAGHSKATNIASGLFFDWSTQGQLKLDEIMIRRSNVSGDAYEEYKPSLQDQIDELKKEIQALTA